MPAWLLWPLGALLLASEGVVLRACGVSGWSVQVAIVLTAYVALRREVVPGALILALWMPLMEWTTGGPTGMYSLGLVAVYGALRLPRRLLERRWGVGHAFLCALAAPLHHLTLAGYLLVTRPSSPMLKPILASAPLSALITGLGGLLIGGAIARLDRAARPRAAHDQLL